MKKTLILLFLITVTITLSGCAAADKESAYYGEESEYTAGFSDSTDQDFIIDPGTETVEPLNDSNIPALDSRKIIYEAKIVLIVDDLENLKTNLSALQTNYNAYYDGYEESKTSLVINLRVPSSDYHNFIADLNQEGEVASMSQTAEDITNNYSTFEARKEALEAQYDAVQALLADAEELSDILTLRGELANIESELNNIGKTLDNYDDLVDYSSIELTVSKLDDLSELLDKAERPRISVVESSKSEMVVTVSNNSQEAGTVYLKLIENGEVLRSYEEEIYGNASYDFVIKELDSGVTYTLEASYLESNHRLSNTTIQNQTTDFTFSSRIGNTFQMSYKSLIVVVQALGLIVTAVIPYAIVFGLLFLPIRYVNKKYLKENRRIRRIRRENEQNRKRIEKMKKMTATSSNEDQKVTSKKQ